MPDHLIEFLCLQGVSPTPIPRPVPAAQAPPAWLKTMPSSVAGAGPGGGELFTVKKCPPMVDALTGGYLIPLAADIEFEMKQNELTFRCELPLVQTHPREQVRGTPLDTGVPLAYFDEAKWELRPFGNYVPPIAIFSGNFQPKMRQLFIREKAPRLDFGIGYRYRPNETSILVATRKSPKS